jgi:5-oxoprolinase (ATP-hydrolysing)
MLLGTDCHFPDRGGTFCDVWASAPGRADIVLKLLSEDPENYRDAPTEGVRRALEIFAGLKVPKDKPINGRSIEWIRVGTTGATKQV